MSFKSVFIAVFLGMALIVAALIVNGRRPAVETERQSAKAVKATGQCATCHRHETSTIVVQFESSHHAADGVTCLGCHGVAEGQESHDHKGYTLAATVTAKNCAQCHTTEYEQYARSRHAGPAWAAVAGKEDFST